jgi:HEPN domain-containing protein
MSIPKNVHEAQRWIQTAEEDLRACRVLIEKNMYAQACFYCQQSGEKAVRAVWYLLDKDPWGHSIKKLVDEFPGKNEIKNFKKWIEWSSLLDRYYVPTRYPNGLPDLTPGQVYDLPEARRGIDAAERLVGECKEWMKKKSKELGR